MDERDGRRLWQKPIHLALLNSATGYSFVQQATSTGQLPANSLVAYRTADGVILWQIPSDKDAFDIVGDEHVLVLEHLMGLNAIRASDGASLWFYAPPTRRNLVAEAVAGGLVFALSMNTSIYRLGPPPGTDVRDQLLVLDANNGRLYWQVPLDPSDITIAEAS
jgi:outer membrane protein assembly factor BamB